VNFSPYKEFQFVRSIIDGIISAPIGFQAYPFGFSEEISDF